MLRIKFSGGRDSFRLRNPLLRQAPERYRSVYKDSLPHIQAQLVLSTHKAEKKSKELEFSQRSTKQETE